MEIKFIINAFFHYVWRNIARKIKKSKLFFEQIYAKLLLILQSLQKLQIKLKFWAVSGRRIKTMLWIFPDYGGSSLRKAWILPRLPCQGDKAVCGWQAERFQFHAKNPYRKFEQRAKSGTVSMRWNACNICLRLTF